MNRRLFFGALAILAGIGGARVAEALAPRAVPPPWHAPPRPRFKALRFDAPGLAAANRSDTAVLVHELKLLRVSVRRLRAEDARTQARRYRAA